MMRIALFIVIQRAMICTIRLPLYPYKLPQIKTTSQEVTILYSFILTATSLRTQIMQLIIMVKDTQESSCINNAV